MLKVRSQKTCRLAVTLIQTCSTNQTPKKRYPSPKTQKYDSLLERTGRDRLVYVKSNLK